MDGPVDPNPWSQWTRDAWFFAALVASVLALAWLFWPFASVLLFAATTVVVTWPFYERVLRMCRGRRILSSLLTVLLLAIVIFGPVGFVVQRAVIEGAAVADQAIAFVASGEIEGWIRSTLARDDLPWMTTALGYVGPDFDPAAVIIGPVREGLLWVGQQVTSWLPQLIRTVVGRGLDAVIFVGVVVSLYAEGPTVLRVARRLSPMDDAYEERLFLVFQEFANNLVVGSLATAFLQGLVAGVGYSIAGVDRLLLVTVLTACFSFVPMVGTAMIWIPVALQVASEHGLGWGIFVALWSLLVTGTVDNVVKPLFLRGSSAIHPMLIFLAVFGGLRWMGLPGVLVGPVLVAAFLALYTIYCQDYLGAEPREELTRQRPLIDRLLALVEDRFPDRVLPWVARPEPPVAPVEPPVARVERPVEPAELPPAPVAGKAPESG